MRKSTKNKITKAIHAILIILTVVVALMASVYAALRDFAVQSMIVRSAAGFVSQSLNTEVKIKTFYITPNLEIHLNGMQINDLEQYPMLKIDEFVVKLSFEIVPNGLAFKEIYLKNAYGNIVTYEGNELSNVAELFSQEPKEEKEKNSDFDARIKVDKVLIDNAHFILWDQNNDNPERRSMDYKHIDIDSIGLNVKDFEYKFGKNDTISCFIKNLTAKERCGINIKSFSTSLLFCPTDIALGNLLVDLNDSHLDMDLEFKINGFDDFQSFVDSVVLISNIRNTNLKLNDIRYLAEIMEKMPNEIFLNTDFYGPINDFKLENLDLSFGDRTNIKGFMSMQGICKGFDNSYWIVDFQNLKTSYDDLVNFYIPSSSVTIPIPEKLEPLGNVTLSIDYKGTPVNFDAKIDAKTEIGDVKVDLLMRRDSQLPEYKANVVANDIDVAELLGNEEPFNATMALGVEGKGFNKKDADLTGLLRVKSLEIKQNKFEDFNLDFNLKNEKATAITQIKNPDVFLDIIASANLKNTKPVISANATIKNANLPALHLVDTDSVMILSTKIDASFCGFKLDELVADLKINDMNYFNGKEHYNIDNFTASLHEKKGLKSCSIDCDFFDFQADGIIHFNSFMNAMKNAVLNYVHVPAIKKTEGIYDVEKQEFALKLNLKDTEVLTSLFMPNLHIAPNTSLTATYTTGKSNYGQTLECPYVRIGNILVKNIELRNNVDNEKFASLLTLEDVILRDSTEENPQKMNIENVALTTNLCNDTIFIGLNWDNNKPVDRNNGDIKAFFVPYEDRGGLLSIKSDGITLNDTVLKAYNDCFIDFQGDRIYINNFGLSTDLQAFEIEGYFPNNSSDTLKADFKNLDASDLNILMYAKNLRFDGILNGDVSISGLKEQLAFTSALKLSDFYVNDENVGDIQLNSTWDDPNQAIHIDAVIFNRINNFLLHKTFGLSGNYYPQKNENSLDMVLAVNKFKLNSLQPFLGSVIGKMDGEINGNVDVTGSLSKPVLEGNLVMKDAGCKINFLNTYYKINDTIRLSENRMDFSSLKLLDTLGNRAVIIGKITHNYLKDFNLDLRLQCDNFVAMNIPAEKASGFYGSAIANGEVIFSGPIKNILLDIDVETKKGTVINIPLSGRNKVDNNFIVFVDKQKVTDTVENFIPKVESSNNLTIDLKADVNPDAELNIYLPSDMGKINAKGTGNVNLGMESGNLNLKGNYLINSGQFAFRLEVVSRNFDIRRGGSLQFNGNPTDADINIVAAYRTKVSLKSLGSSIDTTSLKGNVNVDCILHLQDKLMNPKITFGLEFPNAKDDIKAAVFSVIDSTNQSVMAQQVLSLMVIGMFANTGTANVEQIGTTATYNVITSQLNNWLSQMSKDFDIGVNYKPNSNYTNEELEVAMSTQLFDDRLTIEGNFGVVRGNAQTQSNPNNIVGDLDVTYKLTNILSIKAYNHTNVNNNYNYYSYENLSDYTQGLGISLSQSFDRFSEIFIKQKKEKSKKKDKKGNKDEPK